MDFDTLKKGWSLLDTGERRVAVWVLFVVLLASLAGFAMVGSVIPFLTVLSNPDSIKTNHYMAWLYERFNFSSEYRFLVFLGVISIALIVISSVLQIARTYVIARFAQMRAYTLSRRLLAAYLGQDYEFHIAHHSGTLTTRVVSEVDEVANHFFRPVSEAVAALSAISALVVLLLIAEPVIALVAFGVLGGLYVLIYALIRARVSALGKARFAANAERFKASGEALGGVKEIKLLGREGYFVQEFQKGAMRNARSRLWIAVLTGVPQFALQAVALGGILLLSLLLIDPAALASGEGTGKIVPVLGLFAFAGQKLMPELSRLYQAVTKLQSGAPSVRAVHQYVAEAGNRPLQRGELSHLELTRELCFEDVSYRYPGAEQSGIRNLSLDIRAGDRIGVVGNSGAGKTTFADLLLGLLRPSAGRILVDGVELSNANLCNWQRSVGYVQQDIYLTDASISCNIALGVPEAKIDHERVRRAASHAKLTEFVENELPEGFNTFVGERGVRLSGGQRQRIGIARCLYHEATLIVLDEATSALDNLTERDVMRAIDALPRDITVLIVAHRLSTLKNCNKIALLSSGQLAGFDSWAGLYECNKAFRDMVGQASVERIGADTPTGAVE